MSYSLIASTVKGQAGSPNTTSAIDTTGADLIVVIVAKFDVGGTLSDSQSNTWTNGVQEAGFGRYVICWYCQNPSTSATHTFTSNATVPRLAVYAFSGSVSTPFDQSNTNSTADVSTQTTGSVTPTENNELLVVGCYEEAMTGTGTTINSSFTGLLEANDNTWGIVAAYKIQTTAGAENPTFTFPSNNHVANAVIATFKDTPAGGGFTSRLPLLKAG